MTPHDQSDEGHGEDDRALDQGDGVYDKKENLGGSYPTITQQEKRWSRFFRRGKRFRASTYLEHTAWRGRAPEVPPGAGDLTLRGTGGWTPRRAPRDAGFLSAGGPPPNLNQILGSPGESRPHVAPPARPRARAPPPVRSPTFPRIPLRAAGGWGRGRGRCRAGRLALGPPPLPAQGHR